MLLFLVLVLLYVRFWLSSHKFQAITSSGIKKGEHFIADVNTQLKNKNITTDVKVDTSSNVSDEGLSVMQWFECIWFLSFLHNLIPSEFFYVSPENTISGLPVVWIE